MDPYELASMQGERPLLWTGQEVWTLERLLEKALETDGRTLHMPYPIEDIPGFEGTDQEDLEPEDFLSTMLDMVGAGNYPLFFSIASLKAGFILKRSGEARSFPSEDSLLTHFRRSTIWGRRIGDALDLPTVDKQLGDGAHACVGAHYALAQARHGWAGEGLCYGELFRIIQKLC